MSAFDSSKETNSTSNTSGTSTAQSSYAGQVSDLNAAYDAALKAFQTSGQATAPTNFVAGFDPSQLDAFRSMIGYGNNNTVPNAQAGTGTAVAGSGAAGTQGALAGLAGFNPADTNNPNSLVEAAKQYMAGQDIPSQVRQAMQSGTETARDVTLPGIEQNAAGTGNTNSSRTGIAEGLVQRGLAETGANMTGALSSNAFQQGLQLAQTQAQNNNANKLGALGAEGTVGNTAGYVGNTQQNSSVTNMIQQLTAAANGGAGLTAGQQASLDNMLKQYQAGVSTPYAPLDQLMQIISGNTGQTTNTTGTTNGTSTTTSSPSLISDIGSVAGALSKL